MSLPGILEAFTETPAARELANRIPGRGSALRIGGLPGSSAAMVLAWLLQRFPQRLFTVVAPTPAEAERWLNDLQSLTSDPVALYPQREGLGEEEPHYEIAGERAETLAALLTGRLRLLVTTARATAERTRVPGTLLSLRLRLVAGSREPLSGIVARLESMGYRRVPAVTEVAEFSVRGGIVDVYGFGMADPARCEWWGDDLHSIRTFDLTTQRSGEPLGEVTILPLANPRGTEQEA
ncbi:MAG: hypothetical protein ACREL6_11970, partial [Gemmatimonadales bacterium]